MPTTTIAWMITAVATLLLAIATWRHSTHPIIRAILTIITAVVLTYALTDNTTASWLVIGDVLLIFVTWYLVRSQRITSLLGIVWIVVLVVLLFVAKIPQVQTVLGPGIWIGVSYLIFRLIHIVLDARRNRIGDAQLSEAVVYVLHPATLVAGPIDRIQHNVTEQRSVTAEPKNYVNNGIWRLFIGLFKKAALANLLYAFIAQHDMTQNPNQSIGIAWLWLLAYTFYLYLDFAAYSDMAIGVGLLMGMQFPENFANPYAQPTIGRFWQSWHITLSSWLRDYIFFPMSRNLVKHYGSQRSAPILLLSHLTTMVACGLWHGLGTGFVAWGVWHGLGLFGLSQVPALRRRFNLPVLPTTLSIVLTFGFVMLGWVFFSTDLPTALRIFGRLFGVS
jgi:alginate O-acetyltransferase complex protein AlgI